MSGPIPDFAHWVRNTQASEDNPHRDGMFVRTVRIQRGRINSGVWWELTNGHGDFWLSDPAHAQRLCGALPVLRGIDGGPHCLLPLKHEGVHDWHPDYTPSGRCKSCGNDIATHAMGDAYGAGLRKCHRFVP